jgi:hypothetical protein
MGYRIMGRAHASLYMLGERLRGQAGQGTVEYVALILLVAGIFAAVVAFGKKSDGGGIAQKVTAQLKDAIERVDKK